MENKRKHLEFIQLVVTRMNVNSFLLKGWAVTLVAALFAFAAKDTNIDYVLITLISTPMFWFLDGYYLSQERKYRSLYNYVKEKEEDEINYDMNTAIYDKGRNKWLNSVFSKTIFLFYGILVIITFVIYFIIK
jgi:hypothetical protein